MNLTQTEHPVIYFRSRFRRIMLTRLDFFPACIFIPDHDDVYSSISLSDNPLTSIEGFPMYIDGSVRTSNLHGITNLKGSPLAISGEFATYLNRGLTSLEGSPLFVEWGFDISHTSITSLEGGPLYVGGSYDFSYVPIKSISELKHLPYYVGSLLQRGQIEGQWYTERELYQIVRSIGKTTIGDMESILGPISNIGSRETILDFL